MREYDEGYRLGYVVVTWNQASGQPSIDDGDIYDRLDEVEGALDDCREEAARVGRRERHTIAVLVEPEGLDGDPADDGSAR